MLKIAHCVTCFFLVYLLFFSFCLNLLHFISIFLLLICWTIDTDTDSEQGYQDYDHSQGKVQVSLCKAAAASRELVNPQGTGSRNILSDVSGSSQFHFPVQVIIKLPCPHKKGSTADNADEDHDVQNVHPDNDKIKLAS